MKKLRIRNKAASLAMQLGSGGTKTQIQSYPPSLRSFSPTSAYSTPTARTSHVPDLCLDRQLITCVTGLVTTLYPTAQVQPVFPPTPKGVYLLGCNTTGDCLLDTLPGDLCHHHVGEAIEHLREEGNEGDLQLRL